MMKPGSDAELMAAVRGGDEAAAHVLYHRHVDTVYRIAWRILLDEGLAKDCSQDVWIKVFQKAHRFDPTKKFTSWLSSIAVRTAIDLYRKRGKVPPVSLDDEAVYAPPSNLPNGRDTAEEAQLKRQIVDELERLSGPQRAAFILRHFEGASLAEISEALQCSEGTVKTHIHRAVKAVRQALAHYVDDGHNAVERHNIVERHLADERRRPCLENG